MRQIYLRIFLVGSVLFLLFSLARAWIIRPTNCLPECSGVTLNNRGLQNYDLRNAVMVEADLRGSDLRDADLSGADFSGANMAGVNLSNANLTGARFIGTNLAGADLRNTVLTDTDFSGAHLTGANLTRTNLTETRLAGTILDDARLVEVNLAGVNLAGATITNADLTGSDLSEIIIAGSSLSNADLSGAVLTNADLSGSWINLANLAGTDLSESNLAGSSLIGTDLSSANLTNSSLVGVTAVGADFSGAILNGANLTGGRLFQFEIKQSDLTTDPALLELNELRLRQVTTNANLSGVEFTENTLWPAGKSALLNALLGTEFAESQIEALFTGALEDEEVPDPIRTDDPDGQQLNPEQVAGDMTIFGSSDILTLTQVIAEQFTEQGYDDTISMESIEIHEGFEQFCQPDNEIDILNASRSIRDSELAICATIGLTPVRFRIGTDAIAVVVNPSNDFIQDATLEDLSKIFTVERWNDVNPDWPAEPIVRYIPSGESSSRELFLQTVFGIRTDNAEAAGVLFDAPNATPSQTYQELILGVAREPDAVGFMPFEAYEQNADILSILTIDGAELNAETVETGDYPLARPLLLYTDPAILREKTQVVAFLNFYLASVRELNDRFSYFISSDRVLAEARTALEEAATVVPTDTVAAADREEEDLADIFNVPNPLIPLAPISPTLGLSPTDAPDPTELEDLAGSIVIVENSSVLSPTETIINGFEGLGFTGTISRTAVSTAQAFQFFCDSDQADIIGVNRLIQDDETSECNDNGRQPLAFRIGTDVIAIVTNPNNDFVRDVTLEELALLFTARRWSDINPDWPAEPIQRFIPPDDSSVFDLFVETVLNDEADQLLLAPNLINVTDPGRQALGISTNPYALGFMEYPAYERNAGLLNLVSVNEIVPEDTTIEENEYPLLRPLLLYADADTLAEKPQVAALLNFYLTNAQVALEPLNYVPPSSQALDDARTTLRQAVNVTDSTPTPTP